MRQIHLLLFPIVLAAHAAGAAQPAPAAGPQATLEQRVERLEQDLAEARDERDFEKIRAELIEANASDLENLIAMFGVFITVILITFTIQYGRAALAEAKAGAAQAVIDEQAALHEALGSFKIAVAQWEARLDQIQTKSELIQTESERQFERLSSYSPANLPQDQVMKDELRNVAAAAQLKPRAQRSIEEYRALINATALREDWQGVINLAAEMVKDFGERDASATAFALLARGVALENDKCHDAALSAYDDLLTRFLANPLPDVRQCVAKAQFNKGASLGSLNRHEEELEAYERVIRHFGSSTDPELLRSVGKALVNKCHMQMQAGQFEASLLTCAALLATFEEDAAVPMQDFVAKALINDGVAQGRLNRPLKQLEKCDEVISRFGSTTDTSLQELVHKAMFNRACVNGRTASVAACLADLARWRDMVGKLHCEKIANDRDFDPVRNDPDFIAFLAENGCCPAPAERARPPRKPKARAKPKLDSSPTAT